MTLVSGPVALPDPPGITVCRVDTAAEMLAACRRALPADAAVFAAAVADWRMARPASAKLKKDAGPPVLDLVSTEDILATLSRPGPARPLLTVGFAAETDDLLANARAKLARKGCDWIVANDVRPETGAMGGARNTVHLISPAGEEHWPELPKEDVAIRLAKRIAETLGRDHAVT